jgi:hypothetical protein
LKEVRYQSFKDLVFNLLVLTVPFNWDSYRGWTNCFLSKRVPTSVRRACDNIALHFLQGLTNELYIVEDYNIVADFLNSFRLQEADMLRLYTEAVEVDGFSPAQARRMALCVKVYLPQVEGDWNPNFNLKPKTFYWLNVPCFMDAVRAKTVQINDRPSINDSAFDHTFHEIRRQVGENSRVTTADMIRIAQQFVLESGPILFQFRLQQLIDEALGLGDGTDLFGSDDDESHTGVDEL